MVIAAIVKTEHQASQSAPQSGWSARLNHVRWRVYHHATKHVGVGIVCSVAYLDPGNWSADMQAGSQYGYSLLFTVLLTTIFVTFLQVLASRLGVVTGLDLASHCRLLFHDRPRHKLLWRWCIFYPLYVLSEMAIICTDWAEMLGSAIALVLLFPVLPLWSAVLLTAADVMFILTLENPFQGRPPRLFEGIIATLVLTILICMAVITSRVTVSWGDAFRGYLPAKELFTSGSLYGSVAIVGAIVMPHSLFLGSHLATQNRLAINSEENSPELLETSTLHQMTVSQRVLQYIRCKLSWRRLFSISRSDETSYPPNVLTHADRENNKLDFIRSHIHHGVADIITSLMCLTLVVNSILILSSAVFYYNSGAYGNESPASLFDAYSLIKSNVGNGAALIFALALLASGQSASLIATIAGQSVSEGFLYWKVSPTLRRLITRVIAVIPSIIIASISGEKGINSLLVASQVVLSVVLPFIIFPLLYLTSSSRIMSVRSHVETTSLPSDQTSDLPALTNSNYAADHGDSLSHKDTDVDDQVVDFSSGKIMTAIGVLMCLLILAANVYVLVTL